MNIFVYEINVLVYWEFKSFEIFFLFLNKLYEDRENLVEDR